MQQAPVDVMVAAYRTEHGAKDALNDLAEAQKQGIVKIKDAAVLRKDMESRLHIVDVKDMGFGRGALIGGVTGAIAGIIAGPVGWVAIGGAAIGGLAAKLRDGGFKDDRLRRIGDSLQPGSSALVAVIEHEWVREVERMIAETGAEIATDIVAADVADQLEREAMSQADTSTTTSTETTTTREERAA